MRIAGITLPDNKPLEFALTSIYGIGRAKALKILADVKIDPAVRPAELTPEQEITIREHTESFQVEGELRRDVAGNIKRLKEIQAYRGSRHSKHLPARGQRTKTNSRTVRGNVRRTMTSGRRKVEKT